MNFTKQLAETELRAAVLANNVQFNDWVVISEQQTLSENFMREFASFLDWEEISKKQVLSEEFITEFKELLHMDYVVIYQQLSEEFIRANKDELNWYSIAKYQMLSDEFIEEFKHLLDLNILCKKVIRSCGAQKEIILVQRKNVNEIIIGASIGHFTGTKEEAIQAVQEKYGLNSEYEKQILECFNF